MDTRKVMSAVLAKVDEEVQLQIANPQLTSRRGTGCDPASVRPLLPGSDAIQNLSFRFVVQQSLITSLITSHF
jgi:hypothetical protein